MKRSRVLCTEVANATRWTGIMRCAHKTRLLEVDIKVALTGDKDGLCEEEESDSKNSDQESVHELDTFDMCSDVDSENSSTMDGVEAEENGGKVGQRKYPFANRCLSASEFKLNNQLESVLLPSHEAAMLFQLGSGIDPGTAFLLAQGVRSRNMSPKLQTVFGVGEAETWKDTSAASLDSMFSRYRSILVEQLNARFRLSSHPGKEVLLCLKMNPLLNTSKESPLFKGKSAVHELMEGEYLHRLTLRLKASRGNGKQLESKSTSASTSSSMSNSHNVLAKRSLTLLQEMQAFEMMAPSNTTSIDDSIHAEIMQFEAIKSKLAATSNLTYREKGIFNAIKFWNDHRMVCVLDKSSIHIAA